MIHNMTTILINTSFEGIHKYEDAPNEVAYLRDPHRHIFHVNVEMEVFHTDRELEFIMVKHELDKYINKEPFSLSSSCEKIATMICRYLLNLYGERRIICTVLEDGENGGRVYYGY